LNIEKIETIGGWIGKKRQQHYVNRKILRQEFLINTFFIFKKQIHLKWKRRRKMARIAMIGKIKKDMYYETISEYRTKMGYNCWM